MTDQLSAARSFLFGHARVLDRRRFELLLDGGDAEPVLAALRAYRNADGGSGTASSPTCAHPGANPRLPARLRGLRRRRSRHGAGSGGALRLPGRCRAARRRVAVRPADRGRERHRAVLGAGRSGGLLAPDHRGRHGVRQPTTTCTRRAPSFCDGSAASRMRVARTTARSSSFTRTPSGASSNGGWPSSRADRRSGASRARRGSAGVGSLASPPPAPARS